MYEFLYDAAGPAAEDGMRKPTDVAETPKQRMQARRRRVIVYLSLIVWTMGPYGKRMRSAVSKRTKKLGNEIEDLTESKWGSASLTREEARECNRDMGWFENAPGNTE